MIKVIVWVFSRFGLGIKEFTDNICAILRRFAQIIPGGQFRRFLGHLCVQIRTGPVQIRTSDFDGIFRVGLLGQEMEQVLEFVIPKPGVRKSLEIIA